MQEKEKQIVVIYHNNCSDGFGAAYAAWRKFGDEAEYVSANYGNEPPDVTGKEVYILDFSYPRETLVEMHSKAKSLLVIDHHKTAQEALSGLDFAIFDMDKSGCILAWNYFHKQTYAPKFLNLIQDRDLWKFELEDTKPFHDGLRAFVPFDFGSWRLLENGAYLLGVIKRGADVQFVFEKDIADFSKHKTEMILSGIKGLGCNVPPKFSSELGNVLAKESGTFGCTYSYSGADKKWWYSLRSIGDFDVSEIAKFYDGGGHKNAAGFSLKFLVGF